MSLLRRFESRLAITEPCFGIIKPMKGLNTKPNLGNVLYIARKSAATELKTPLIDATSEGLKVPQKGRKRGLVFALECSVAVKACTFRCWRRQHGWNTRRNFLKPLIRPD